MSLHYFVWGEVVSIVLKPVQSTHISEGKLSLTQP